MAFGQFAKPLVQPLLSAKCVPLNFDKQMVHSENFFEPTKSLLSSRKISGSQSLMKRAFFIPGQTN
jgi:hypothetical protein